MNEKYNYDCYCPDCSNVYKTIVELNGFFEKGSVLQKKITCSCGKKTILFYVREKKIGRGFTGHICLNIESRDGSYTSYRKIKIEQFKKKELYEKEVISENSDNESLIKRISLLEEKMSTLTNLFLAIRKMLNTIYNKK